MSDNPYDEVYKQLARYRQLQHRLILLGAAFVVAAAVFAVIEVRQLRHHQEALANLTESLCLSLGRAGMILEGPRESPCARLPSSQSQSQSP